MSKHHLQSEGMKALEQSLNDHMEICRLQRKAKRLKAENARLKAEVERLRKAGDAMALCITEFRCGRYGNALDKVGGFYVWQDWLAAKEGKQS